MAPHPPPMLPHPPLMAPHQLTVVVGSTATMEEGVMEVSTASVQVVTKDTTAVVKAVSGTVSRDIKFSASSCVILPLC